MHRPLRLIGILLGAVLALGNTQCQQSGSTVSSGPAFVTTLSVEDANSNAASQFSQGQTIQFVISVHNRLNTPQTIVLREPSCATPYYSVAVVAAGTSNVMFASSNNGIQNDGCQIAVGSEGSPLTFVPNQTMTFTITWNQTDATDQLVAPGNYEVMGGIICWNPPPAGGPMGSYDTAACMAPGIPTSTELMPTQLRSDLVAFTIQQ